MTKTLLSERLSSFVYTNAFTDKTCIVNIVVEEYMYDDGNEYYYISYDFAPEEPKAHPFHDDPCVGEGDIVFKNNMTSAMVTTLLMPDSELYQRTGNTMTSDYRRNIMKSLSLFWD